MSYNLESTLFKNVEKKGLINLDSSTMYIICDPHFVEHQSICEKGFVLNLPEKSIFENLKQKYKISLMKWEYLDFYESLCEKVERPDDFVRIEIFNYLDMATYVKKEIQAKYNFDELSEMILTSNFDENDVIFIYKPKTSKREIDVIVFEHKDYEYSACFIDRMKYNNYLPKPVSEDWWDTFMITNEEDFKKFSMQCDFDDERPMQKWDFIDGEHLIYITK